MEEVLLHNPQGEDNIETAKSYFSQAIKLNGNNLRALYGLYLVKYY